MKGGKMIFYHKMKKNELSSPQKTPRIPRGEMGEITREKELFYLPAASQWERAISPAKLKFCSPYFIF